MLGCGLHSIVHQFFPSFPTFPSCFFYYPPSCLSPLSLSPSSLLPLVGSSGVLLVISFLHPLLITFRVLPLLHGSKVSGDPFGSLFPVSFITHIYSRLIIGNLGQLYNRQGWDWLDGLGNNYNKVVKLTGLLGVCSHKDDYTDSLLPAGIT